MIRTDTHTTVFDSPVGPLSATSAAGRLTKLSFIDRVQTARRSAGDDILLAVQQQIAEYFDGRRKEFDIPLDLQGPAFHRRVWTALLDIPFGATISYGTLAKSIGEPDAARAVGAANGANPIVIIVPCHRVIGADGSLVGYGGGLTRKQTLLDLESGKVGLFKTT
jgi:methylated-DNA-[protein]-cysteine S-methyltransferase